jgi:prepilin-type N-terminal cleavage/methylation domain-containing protein
MTAPTRRDDGFTLLELVVAIAMITVMTAGLTSFYVQTSRTSGAQSQAQVADHLASSTMESVSLLPGDALVTGRPACAVSQQWALSIPGISDYLADMTAVSDSRLTATSCPGSAAAMDILYQSTQLEMKAVVKQNVNGKAVDFTRYIYVGECWMSNGSECAKPTAATPPAGKIAMLRVAIAVTWLSARCSASTCSYVTDTLVTENTSDLTFKLTS